MTSNPSPSSYPVKGLTKIQRDTFEAIACGQDMPNRPKTLSALIKKGVIVEVGKKVVCKDRFGIVETPVYEVPLVLHLAWCQWCSDNIPDSDL